MKLKITKENMFENDKTKSILNLLIEFNSLHPREIRYALNPEKYTEKSNKKYNPEFECNIQKIQEKFGKELESFYRSKRIIKGCIKNRSDIKYYLSILEKLNAIMKDKKGKEVEYSISDWVYNEGIRLYEKECIDYFPSDKIKFYKIKDISGRFRGYGHVLYGFSKETYKLLGEEDRIKILKNLEKINTNINDIYNLKLKCFKKEKDKRFNKFINETKSNRIKILLEEAGFSLFLMFLFKINFKKMIDNLDLFKSKKDFILSFKYEGWSESLIHDSSVFKIIKKKNDSFSDKEFCKRWANRCLGCDEDYDLTKSDIEEIIQWGWKNKDLFELFLPMEIAYSRINIYSDSYPLKSI